MKSYSKISVFAIITIAVWATHGVIGMPYDNDYDVNYDWYGPLYEPSYASVPLELSSAPSPSSLSTFDTFEVGHGVPVVQIQHLPPDHPFRPPTAVSPTMPVISIEEAQTPKPQPVVTIPPVSVKPIEEVKGEPLEEPLQPAPAPSLAKEVEEKKVEEVPESAPAPAPVKEIEPLPPMTVPAEKPAPVEQVKEIAPAEEVMPVEEVAPAPTKPSLPIVPEVPAKAEVPPAVTELPKVEEEVPPPPVSISEEKPMVVETPQLPKEEAKPAPSVEAELSLPPTPTPAKVEAPSPAGSLCPAITWTHRFHCSQSEKKCLVSFINTSQHPPVDWVDIHLSSNAPEAMKLSGLGESTSLSSSARFDYRMKQVAGVRGLMHGSMSSSMPHMMEEPKQLDSVTSLPLSSALAQSLLQETKGIQVFQLAIPLSFTEGRVLEAKFTYCANGVDCDTETVQLKMESEAVAPKLKESLAPSAPLVCPPIQYKPDVDCSQSHASSSSDNCIVSFINLTPNRPLDWVDLHFKSDAPVALQAVGFAIGQEPLSSSQIEMNQPIKPIQLNFRMKHAAGDVGKMMMMMEDTMEGSDMKAKSMPMDDMMTSVGLSLLNQNPNSSQVFSFPISAAFMAGQHVSAFFTYCANGLDCDTEEMQLTMKRL